MVVQSLPGDTDVLCSMTLTPMINSAVWKKTEKNKHLVCTI